jgi:hypothetical protein
MPKPSLRGRILRLAVENPKLRPHLAELLREAGGLSETEKQALQQPLIHQPVISPQQPVVQIVNQAPAAPVAPVAPAPVAPVAPPAPAPAPAAPAPAVPAPAPPTSISPNQSTIGVPEAEAPVAPVSSLFVPERAQQGFNAELLPEMEKLLAQGIPRAQIARDMLDLVQSSFSKKDTLYNILIRYQSSFEGNEEYLRNLESMVEAWATSNSGA